MLGQCLLGWSLGKNNARAGRKYSQPVTAYLWSTYVTEFYF